MEKSPENKERPNKSELHPNKQTDPRSIGAATLKAAGVDKPKR